MTGNAPDRPHVLIVGAGALGSLIGGLLAENGVLVTLLNRSPAHPQSIAKAGGLTIVGHGGQRLVPLRATSDAEAIDPIDVAVFLCKAGATPAAAHGVRHLFNDDRAVAVSFQNGLGNEEAIGAAIGEHRVIAGLTLLGARLEAPGVVRNFADLPSYIGEIGGGHSARTTELARLFSDHGVPTQASSEIMREKWKKLFANVAFSATSAATGLTIAEVAGVPELSQTALRAIDEAADVAAACGIAIDATERRTIFERLIDPNGAGANTTSMYRDLQAKRASEVDQIYGEIIARGLMYGIPTPTLQSLSGIVKGLEAKVLAGRSGKT